MKSVKSIAAHLLSMVITLSFATLQASAAEEWEVTLRQALVAEHSQTRQDGLKQIDTTTKKGLQALWKTLANPDPHRVDWYVRQGAYDALLQAEGEEVDEEIDKLLKGSKNPLAQEAVIHAIVWKIRKQVVEDRGHGQLERRREEAKMKIRKLRGVDYFEFVLPSIKKLDPEQKQLGRIHKAMKSKSGRVRIAAITGLMAYPHRDNVPLLLGHLEKLERRKSKYYREWVLTRFALEQLTGQYFREVVEDWKRWWEIAKDTFSIEKRIEEKKGEESGSGKTVVVKRDGIEVTVHMKVAGKGYPLIVLPWRGYEVDYMRPYFHGIEEFAKVYYLRMPQLADYKGLARDTTSNTVQYPTKLLAKALDDITKDSDLDQYALLAHGWEAGHLAMLHLQGSSQKVSCAMFINPWSGGGSFRRIVKGLRRIGLTAKNQELVKGADSRFLKEDGKPEYIAVDDDEEGGMSRALNNQRFADPTQPEIGNMQFLYTLPGGTGVLIDSTWKSREILKGDAAKVPSLIFSGERSGWMSKAEAGQVGARFPRGKVIPLKNSGDCPFMAETYLFTKHVETFLKPTIKRWEKTEAGAKK